MSLDHLARTIMSRADALAAFSEMEGGICRRYGTPQMRAAMDLTREWMQAAGMETAIDAFGNLIGTYAAGKGSAEDRPFVFGGHLDTVRDAGRYDGILGVLSGIAMVESLARDGKRLPFPLQVIAFAEEEGLRYDSLGASRVWAGLQRVGVLEQVDEDGITLAETVRASGGDPDRCVAGAHPRILGFHETHIEQGPVLEAEGLPVGIVSSIVGSIGADITVRGMAGHAGTVPMDLRQDALVAAAEVVLAVERVAAGTPGMVGTVGQLNVQPGASNVIPGQVRLTCEVRHASEAAYRDAIAAIHDAAKEICHRRGVTLEWHGSPGYSPTECDPALRRLLGEAVSAEEVSVRELPSGAGHDAVNISEIAPVSMLFVRCKGGISHNPAESIDVADVEVALRVMVDFLERYAAAKGPAGEIPRHPFDSAQDRLLDA